MSESLQLVHRTMDSISTLMASKDDLVDCSPIVYHYSLCQSPWPKFNFRVMSTCATTPRKLVNLKLPPLIMANETQLSSGVIVLWNQSRIWIFLVEKTKDNHPEYAPGRVMSWWQLLNSGPAYRFSWQQLALGWISTIVGSIASARVENQFTQSIWRNLVEAVIEV